MQLLQGGEGAAAERGGDRLARAVANRQVVQPQLLERGADVSALDCQARTPLHVAVTGGLYDIVSMVARRREVSEEGRARVDALTRELARVEAARQTLANLPGSLAGDVEALGASEGEMTGVRLQRERQA